jgi:hypothetical protein
VPVVSASFRSMDPLHPTDHGRTRQPRHHRADPRRRPDARAGGRSRARELRGRDPRARRDAVTSLLSARARKYLDHAAPGWTGCAWRCSAGRERVACRVSRVVSRPWREDREDVAAMPGRGSTRMRTSAVSGTSGRTDREPAVAVAAGLRVCGGAHAPCVELLIGGTELIR